MILGDYANNSPLANVFDPAVCEQACLAEVTCNMYTFIGAYSYCILYANDDGEIQFQNQIS